MAENEDLVVLDSSDPLNLIINNAAMDDSDPSAAPPPDWSQLGALWPEESVSDSTSNSSGNSKQCNEYIDFNLASSMLDVGLDMSLSGSGIEPSALHLGASDRLGYPSFDDIFQFSSSASPADILAAQFPFSSNGDVLMDSSGLETPNTKPRRLSVTSSSSSSGPSYSPSLESVPSPGYLSPSGSYTNDSMRSSSALSFASLETSFDHSFAEQSAIMSSDVAQSSHSSPVTIASNSSANSDPSGDPAAELAQYVRQSAGVLLAVPMNGNGTPFQAGQLFPTTGPLQTMLPVPCLRSPIAPQKSDTPSSTSSAASTPPPSTPPFSSVTPDDSSSTSAPTSSSIIQPANVARPKTSHTTIERRYRTNLNARIQSLRMAVPALRVLEDRDTGGSSKKIKKNLKTGILIKSANGAAPHGGTAACANDGALNPYGEVDMIDERGYVDGVKVARKCSKANVLGKAVEYIRVLKRRELRLRAEQDGLKALVCGLVGGPALLKEWEREWRGRFGGEERDEVPLDSGEGDDEGDEDDEDDDDDDDGEGAGKKRKRAKFEKDLLPLSKKEPKSASSVVLNSGGQPEKKKRGRPRKAPLPVPTVPVQSIPLATTSATTVSEPRQQSQQYLLAVFVLFSFFNSPVTSPNSHSTNQQSHGHVLSPSPVPLVYAPEIVSQFNPPVVTTVVWRDWVQIAHLAVTVLLFISVLARVGSSLGLTQVRKLVGSDSRDVDKEDVRKQVEMIIIGRDAARSFTHTLTLYRSLPSSTSPIICALYLYVLASSSSAPVLTRPVLRMRARAIWSSATRVDKKDEVILSSTIENVYAALPNIALTEGLNIVDAIAECLIKRELGDILGSWFVREVNSSNSKGKAVPEKPSEDLELLFEAAKHLGGEIAVLAQNVEHINDLHSKATSTTSAAPIVWKAIVPGESILEEEEDSDDSDISSISASIDSLDNVSDEDDNDEGQVPSTIFRALVLYRSLFSVSLPTLTTSGLGLAPPPMISVEPPTPTTPTPVRRRNITLTSVMPLTTPSPSIAASTGQQKKMYALRKILGSRVFETCGEAMEDARDKVVDMLVDAERQSLRARV